MNVKLNWSQLNNPCPHSHDTSVLPQSIFQNRPSSLQLCHMDPYKRNRLIAVGLGTVVVATLAMGIAAVVFYLRDDSLSPRERALVIFDDAPLIDGHNGLAQNIRKMVFNDLSKVDLTANISHQEGWKTLSTSQTDVDRLRRGGVGGQIFVARADCDSQYRDAVSITLEQIDLVKRFLDAHEDDFKLVTSLKEFNKARDDDGKIAAFIAVEGGHSLQSSLGVLRMYYDLGVRIVTLAHSCSTPWIDYSRADHPNKTLRVVSYSHGISSFGEDIVREMNRLGMIVDLTHSSMGAAVDVLKVSKAPVIFSHSAARNICDTELNVSDALLKMVRHNHALVMISFDADQITCDGSDATIQDVIRHLDYIKNRATVDNVGIGSNFDAIERTVRGLEDPSKFPDLFAALIEGGDWSYSELEQLAGGNFLRVLEEVEQVSEDLKETDPIHVFLRRHDVKKFWDRGDCTSPSAYPDPPPSFMSGFSSLFSGLSSGGSGFGGGSTGGLSSGGGGGGFGGGSGGRDRDRDTFHGGSNNNNNGGMQGYMDSFSPSSSSSSSSNKSTFSHYPQLQGQQHSSYGRSKVILKDQNN